MSDLILGLALVLAPTALFLCIRPVGRLAFFLFGLVTFAVLNWMVGISGLHGEGIVFLILPLAILIAAALAEVLVRAGRLVRRLRRRRPLAGDANWPQG
jgi:apolipoprotein N-acyltransferase